MDSTNMGKEGKEWLVDDVVEVNVVRFFVLWLTIIAILRGKSSLRLNKKKNLKKNLRNDKKGYRTKSMC